MRRGIIATLSLGSKSARQSGSFGSGQGESLARFSVTKQQGRTLGGEFPGGSLRYHQETHTPRPAAFKRLQAPGLTETETRSSYSGLRHLLWSPQLSR